MARADLEEEIRNRLYGKVDVESGSSSNKDVCENCGNVIQIDPTVEYVPEHGGDTVHRVTWCNDSCKEAWLEI
jgi:hypothetical protein